MKRQAIGMGIRRTKGKHVLDVWYPKILTENLEDVLNKLSLKSEADTFIELSDDQWTSLGMPKINAGQGYSKKDVGIYIFSEDTAVSSVEEAYFKLQLLSTRNKEPHQLNLDGMFGVLNNIAWTSEGPVLPEDLDAVRLETLSQDRELTVSHVDKFPYLVNYHIPSGVRIASGSQVRLGAYLGEGTTIMPAGYVNFNAGTKGNAMIEGRVSAGVVIGKDSDVGGGASIMGTLSGGNEHVISIGSQCLLGANSGTGISLGQGCTIAAGLYVYAGMKVSLYNEHEHPVNLDDNPVKEGDNIVKAWALSGRKHLLFIQDSRTGKVSCKPNTKVIKLNAQLHKN